MLQKIFSDTFGKSSLELLSTYISPEQIKPFEGSVAAFNKEIARLFGNFDTHLITITAIATNLAATSSLRLSVAFKGLVNLGSWLPLPGLIQQSSNSANSPIL